MISRRQFLLGSVSALLSARFSPAYSGELPVQPGKEAVISRGTNHIIQVSPATGPSLLSVLESISLWRISPGASLTIQMEDGRHLISQTVHFNHPDGSRIQIIGNPKYPEQCTLIWPQKTDGIYVGAGQILGNINGVKLFRESLNGNNNGATDNACGLLADLGGTLITGPDLHIDGFYYGVQARYGGVIQCRGIHVSNAGDAGIFAFNGGHIDAQNSSSKNCSDSRLRLGSGYVAEYGGTIDATKAHATDNALAGFTALSGGSVVANNSFSSGNQNYGLFAHTNGIVIAHEASLSGNAKPIHETLGGRILWSPGKE